MKATLKVGKRFVDTDGRLYECDKPEDITGEQAARLSQVTALDKYGDQIPAFSISGTGAPVAKGKGKGKRGVKPAVAAKSMKGRGDLSRADLERV